MNVYKHQSLYTARFRYLLCSRCSFVTICFCERSPTTTVLSTIRWAIKCDALCKLSFCLFRFFSDTRLYTLDKRIYRRDFFLHLSRLDRILSNCLLYHRDPLNPPTWYTRPWSLVPTASV